MCGIVGFATHSAVVQKLLRGLQALEYRGYDSSGIAVIEGHHAEVRRQVGKLQNLFDLVSKQPLESTSGIGHTRWATHGGATEENAHPHCSRDLIVVHNGIIENYAEIKAQLLQQGFEFKSQTDTEVIAHLIQSKYDQCSEKNSESRLRSVQQAIKCLSGSFALLVSFVDAETEMYAVAKGSPLSLGMSQH